MTAMVASLGCDLDVTDFFCGAGGASSGLKSAGFRVVTAANHWDRAIETHAANHPDTEHLTCDINNLDMRRLPRTRVLWASVICTEISPAGGRRRRPTKGQQTLLEYGSISDAAFTRTRATALDVIRATEVHRYEVVVVENVVDFAADWELFDWWKSGMEILGYRTRIVSVSSAHIAGPGNPGAPQWRDRIYIVFVRTGVPMPDLDPRPAAWCQACEQDVAGVQAWRNGRVIGKYKQQYDYRCPHSACRHAIVEPYVRPAAAAIDWSDIGRRIGDRARPLAATTMRKISSGLAAYAAGPSVLTVNHSDETGRAYPAHAAPLSTRTVRIGDGVLSPDPLLVPVGGTWNDTTYPAGDPMRTLTTRATTALLTPTTEGAFIAELRGGGSTHRPVSDPFATMTATGRHHGLVIPYRNKVKARSSQHPLPTISTRDSAGLIQAAPEQPAQASSSVRVEDCYFRMISPREQLTAQRFDPDYRVHGNQGEQTMQAGNAVSVNVAHWIGRQIAAALDGFPA